MPLSPSQLRQLLLKKKEAFTDFQQASSELIDAYRQGWCLFTHKSLSERLDICHKHEGNTGAIPIEEIPVNRRGFNQLSFQPWGNREESLAWARKILEGVTTFAVDGSQIFPSKDLSLPVALVQVGWFENSHQQEGVYQKDVRLELITPQDLRSSEQNSSAEKLVNARRFELEIERLVEYIHACPQPETCLVFFDGALAVTFTEAFEPEERQRYVQAVLRLLRASENSRVPLVGYVDTSYAHDLTTMLHHGVSLCKTDHIHDAQILGPLMNWGDRIPLHQCDRGGILNSYEEMSNSIYFTYLKTTREGYPARLEIPKWIWEAGQVEKLINRVRAEVIVGGGYPYAIETADQTAVIQNQDRQLFYRILQEWANQEAIGLRFSRKIVSKLRRR